MPSPPPQSARTPRRGGFTLIEVVLVVMVLGVMAGVAVPRYQAALDGMELECAAKRLASDLRLARQTAIQTATTRGLEFSPADDFYQTLTTGGGPIDDPDHPGSPLEVRFDHAGSRVLIDSTEFTDDEIRFDFRGDPTEEGGLVLSTRRSSVTVAVSGAGAVSITP